jgi:lactoylglutathione lyase
LNEPAHTPPRARLESFRARDLKAALTVGDLPASLKWYQEVLGFTVARRYERGGQLYAVALAAGATELLQTQDDGSKGRDRAKGLGISLQFTTVQDIDGLASRCRDHGAALETPPTETPWGVRMFRIRDPDGFLFTIAAAREP